MPVFAANNMTLQLKTLESSDDIPAIVRDESLALYAAVVFKQSDGSPGIPTQGAADPLRVRYELRMPADLPKDTQGGGPAQSDGALLGI